MWLKEKARVVELASSSLKEFSSGLRAREIREIHAFRDAERLTAQEPGTPMQTEEPAVKQDRVCGKEKRPENSF